MGSPDCVLTMQLNSLTPVVCLLLVSACQSLGLEGLKEQKPTREGKKQVGLPCKTIVTEECTEKEVPRFEEVCEWYSEECETEYVKHCENSRENHDGTIDGQCQTTYHRHCYRPRSRRSASEDCAQVPTRHCNLTPGAEEGAGVKVCR